MKPHFLLLSVVCLFMLCSKAMAMPGNGLEINAPGTVQLVYTIEPAEIDQRAIEQIVSTTLADTRIKLGPRPDAQLFLRIEKHAGRYLLYLDFSRKMHYCANGKRFSKAGFVWGRYAKDIPDAVHLKEDIRYMFEEFIEQYSETNRLD